MSMCRRNWFHYGLPVCTELQVLSKTASRLCYYAYKEYRKSNSARHTALLRHIGCPYLRRKLQLQFGNIRNITKNSNFKRHFLEIGWSYCHEILHYKLEDQAQWHISKLYYNEILLALSDRFLSDTKHIHFLNINATDSTCMIFYTHFRIISLSIDA